MKRKILLATTILALSIATGCGQGETNSSEQVNLETVTEETNVEENQENEEVTEETKRDLPEANYEEKGDGVAILRTAAGTSEDGNIPVIYASSDTALLQIDLKTEGFNGGALSFIYVDGILLEKEQLADSQTTLSLVEEQLAVGIHKVEIVQYTGDDPASEMTTYKTASYEIKAE